MITKPLLVLKKYVHIITIIYSATLAVISLVQISDIPDYIPSFSDKVFHFSAYGLLTLLCVYSLLYKYKLKTNHALFFGALLAISFGIIIEVLQGQITNTRVTDQNDILANTFGVLLTTIILGIKNRFDVKKI